MKNILFKTRYFALAIVLTLGFSACVDLEFDAPVVDGICSGESVVNMTIAELKSMHVLGTTKEITDSLIISGVVIGDDASGNFYKKLVIQDETAGIEVYFGSSDLANSYPRGTEIFVNCKGLTLSDYSGVTQIGTIEQATISNFICKGSTGIEIQAKDVEIADLSESDISTLIRLDSVQFADNALDGTYADPVNLSSATNRIISSCNGGPTIILRTSGYSDFAGIDIPNGSGSITAVYSVFNDVKQLTINDTGDVEFTRDRCSNFVVVESLNEDFDDNASNNEDVSIDGWVVISPEGERKWRGKEFDDNTYVQATAYGDTEPLMETWLITPGVNLNNQMVLNFDSQVGFPVAGHDGLKVYYSTDYTDPSTFIDATWIELSGNISDSNSDSFNWLNSGDILLPVMDGQTAVVAFEYKGSGENGDNQTSTYGIDNVKIQAQ